MRRRFAVLAAALAVVLAACGGGGGDESSPGSVGDESSPGSVGDESSPGSGLVSGALADVPATLLGDADLDASFEMYVGDLDAASEVAGLTRPSSGDDLDAVVDWIVPLSGRRDAPVFVPPIELHRAETEAFVGGAAEELGWSIVDVDSFVEVRLPPNRFTVVRGDGLAPAAGLVEDDAGVLSVGDGDDLEADIGSRTDTRPLGRPLRLRSDDGDVAASLTVDSVLAWRTDQPTLADDVAFVAAAEALDEAGVYAAALFRLGTQAVTRPGIDAARAEVEAILGAPTIEAPVLVVGIGWRVVDGEAAARITYVFPDSSTAESQVPVIEELFVAGPSLATGGLISDLLTLSEIQAAGQVVVADVAIPDQSPQVVLSMLFQGDTIFLTP